MKFVYDKKEVKKSERKSLIGTILFTAGVAIGVYSNSIFTLWILGILYAFGIMLIVFGYFLLDVDKVKEVITTDENTAKSVVTVMYSNNVYKFILTAFEIFVFAYLNLPIFVILSWASLGFSLAYKSKLQKYFGITDITEDKKSKKSKDSKYKDRDRFNEIMKKKDKNKKDRK